MTFLFSDTEDWNWLGGCGYHFDSQFYSDLRIESSKRRVMIFFLTCFGKIKK